MSNNKDTKVEKSNNKKEKKLWQKILKILLIIIGAFLLIVIVFFGWLTAVEYRPADVEKVSIDTEEGEGKNVVAGDSMTLLTWNLGYGALGDNADFFMDGGKNVTTATTERVDVNLAGFQGAIASLNPDIIFIQEIDRNAKRSYNKDELAKIQSEYPLLVEEKNKEDESFNGYVSTFAYNMKAKYIPYPLKENIGKVESGIATLSKYSINDSERISLPCAYKWPVKTANFKRCLLVNRSKVYDKDGNDTGKEFVFVNLHLEGYDDSGEGRAKQLNQLVDLIQKEYDKGNYVIAGGDFNHTFTNVDTTKYPIHEEIPDVWKPSTLDVNSFSSDFQCLMDSTNPTCRSLHTAYNTAADKDNFQYYIVDGFIVSKNIKVDSINTYNSFFAPSDHNPVMLTFSLE